MKYLFRTTLWAVLTTASVVSSAYAHGTDPRGGHVDAQMKKLHAIMPMFSLASAELESAIDKGDAIAAKVQADKILAAVPDLIKSTPHKNKKQISAFRSIAARFSDDVVSCRGLVEKADFREARTAFIALEKRCTECHAKFRD